MMQKVPVSSASHELVIDRSRFLALGIPVNSQEEARTHLKALKSQYSDATHVVHCFVIGKPNSLIMGSSDDGEPPGTAGRPTLEVLKGSGISGLLLAVVRWFGGTKLGTGGLVKAYTQAAKELLEILPVRDDVELDEASLTLGYGEYEVLIRHLKELGGSTKKEAFGENVELDVQLPSQNLDVLREFFLDLTKGKGLWKSTP